MTALNFKCNMLEQEVKDTNNETAAKRLLENFHGVEMLGEIDALNNDGDEWMVRKDVSVTLFSCRMSKSRKFH